MRIGVLIAGLLMLPAAAQTSSDKPPKRAQCVVDQKAVTPSAETPLIHVNGQPLYFCGAGCRERFTAWPEKYVRGMVVKCTVQPSTRAHMDLARRSAVNNNLYYLCCEPCMGWMRDRPHVYFKELKDAVSGKWFAVSETNPKVLYKGQVYLFESAETKAAFDQEPGKYAVEFKRP